MLLTTSRDAPDESADIVDFSEASIIYCTVGPGQSLDVTSHNGHRCSVGFRPRERDGQSVALVPSISTNRLHTNKHKTWGEYVRKENVFVCGHGV